MVWQTAIRKAAAWGVAAGILLAPLTAPAAPIQAPTPKPIVPAPGTGTTILSVSGTLTWVTLETPHFEVGNYVLVPTGGLSADSLKAYAGQKVEVTGSRDNGPSIYMKPVLRVTAIKPMGGTLGPGDPVPTPNDPVKVPNDPIKAPNDPVKVPNEPVGMPKDPVKMPPSPPIQPLHANAAYVAFFGTLEHHVGIYRTDDLLAGHLVFSRRYDLSLFAGQKVAAVAKLSAAADRTLETWYEIVSLTRMDTDMADMLEPNGVYSRPAMPVSLQVLGQPFRATTVMGNGHVLVPLRAVATALGAASADIVWEQGTQTATVRLGDRSVSVQVGSTQVAVMQGGQPTTLTVDVAPIIVGGYTLVPLRVLAEGLGAQVAWDAATSTVTVTSK